MQSLALYPPYGTLHVVGAISELIQCSRLRAGLRHRRDLVNEIGMTYFMEVGFMYRPFFRDGLFQGAIEAVYFSGK